MSDAEAPIAADAATVHRALAAAPRPHILELLAEHDTVHFERLAEFVAERTDSDVEPLGAGLHHTHLPVLDAAGALVYDPTAERVGERIVEASAETDAFHRIATFVDARTGGDAQ